VAHITALDARRHQRASAASVVQAQRKGESRTVSGKHKSTDGGTTSVIANRNFMSIMEDPDGNPLPAETTSAEQNLGGAEETLKKQQIEYAKSRSQPSASSSGASGGSGTASASSSGASGSSSGSGSSAPGSSSASQSRFRSKRTKSRVTAREVAREQQREEKEADRQNTLAEVREALEDASAQNEMNMEHDEQNYKRRLKQYYAGPR